MEMRPKNSGADKRCFETFDMEKSHGDAVGVSGRMRVLKIGSKLDFCRFYGVMQRGSNDPAA
jgi:hypothetical protein